MRLLLALVSLALAAADGGVLDRSPVEWPVAEEGLWDDWDPTVAPPPDVVPHLERVIAAYDRGHLPNTLTHLFALLEAAPDYPTGLHQSGTIYFRLRRYGDAIVAFERYLKVAPQRVADTRYLAHSYYSLGRYDDARALYERILELHPDRAASRHGLGLCLMRLGEPDRALAELRRVLHDQPSHADAATWIAQILYDEERIEEALAAVESARALDPFAAKPWFLLSRILHELERDDEAVAAKERFDRLDAAAQVVRRAEAALMLDPAQPKRHAEIVAAHRSVGDGRSVSRALRRWLLVAPEDPGAWRALVQHRTALGDERGAEAARARLSALEATPKNR